MKTSEEALYEHVSYFTNFNPHRHFGNLKALNTCANFLEDHFNQYCLSTSRQTWNARGNDYHNIIGSWRPEKSKRLIVGAHYDVYANNPGADDNASGMAALVEAVKIISTANPELDYGIDFVAYSLEEPPFYGTADMGSYVHAQSIKENSNNILGMICFDMIGYFNDEPGSQNFPNELLASMFPSTANFIIVVGKVQFAEFANQFHHVMNAQNELDVQKIIFPDDNELATLSDHRNYWQIGVNALMINNTAFLRNPNYHEKTDTIDTLDFKRMKLVVDAAIAGITGFEQ